MHGPNHGYIIDMFSHPREKLADLNPALAVFLKLKGRLKCRAGSAFSWEVIHRQWLAMQSRQGRFGIERINVRRSAVRKNMNHTLGFCRKMRRSWRQRRTRIR